MPPDASQDPKIEHLRSRGLLHPHPERVRDELFRSGPFFDPRDLLQVRYEMLRRRRVDHLIIPKVVAQFGVSRPTFYHVEAAYAAHGLPGLVPQKRGPKGPHRCTPDIVSFAQGRLRGDPHLAWEVLLSEISTKFQVVLHRRTLERGLARARKKGRRRRLAEGHPLSSSPSRRSTKLSARRR